MLKYLILLLLTLCSAKKIYLDVPSRIQKGPTCGLYALGMVMDYYYDIDKNYNTTVVFPSDKYNFPPTCNETIFYVAKRKGYFEFGNDLGYADGTIFIADDLAHLAKYFKYKYKIHTDITYEKIKHILKKGHPILIAFDADKYGYPFCDSGNSSHWAVIVGTYNEKYVIAKHGWSKECYIWKFKKLVKSNSNIQHSLKKKMIEIF